MRDERQTSSAASSGRPGRLFYGWWILIACSLLAIFGGAVSQSQTLLVLPMRDELNFNLASTDLIFTLAPATGTVAGLLVGWLADQYG